MCWSRLCRDFFLPAARHELARIARIHELKEGRTIILDLILMEGDFKVSFTGESGNLRSASGIWYLASCIRNSSSGTLCHASRSIVDFFFCLLPVACCNLGLLIHFVLIHLSLNLPRHLWRIALLRTACSIEIISKCEHEISLQNCSS